ncbi:MAG: short-chain dehydrogenase [Alphaproteobacteria bacterium]|nr:short-chain dehydrogenase [Alphaproteobacteria bacterium]
MSRESHAKSAVITGGAGGIGSAVSRVLADSGFSVVVAYNSNADRARALVEELPGDRHFAQHVSIEDADSLVELAGVVAERYEGLDLLVNNAATSRFIPHDDLDALDDALFDQILKVNVRGSFACIRALRSALEAGEGGLVGNMSSIAATSGMGSNVAYCASKAGLDSLTRSLARALAPKIRVVSIAPGVVDTPWIRGFDQEWQDQQILRTPLQQFASPEDVADAVLAVVANLKATTGSVINVDGGRLLG